MKRARNQEGCLYQAQRKQGPDVWEFRYRQTKPDGTRVHRKIVVGTVEQYHNEAEAETAIEALALLVNPETTSVSVINVRQLVEHYRDKELGETKNDWKTFSTKETYRGYIDKWILPRWGDSRLAEVKPGPVEEWLGSIQRSRGTRAKIRNIMSALFRHAMRHELFKRNPITLVRQSAKRAKVPDILEVEEVQTLLGALQPRERMLVLLAAGTGLRLGELLGLKWEDVDFGKLELNVTRSIVKQVVGFCKTEASQKPVPLDAYIAEELRLWKKEADFRAPEDWVFASPQSRGKLPYWGQTLMRCYIRPAAQAKGITKRIGFHTFRRTYSTLLKANGEDVKTVQELLRHASSRVTLDTYAQAVTPAKRRAQSKVIRMIRPDSVESRA